MTCLLEVLEILQSQTVCTVRIHSFVISALRCSLMIFGLSLQTALVSELDTHNAVDTVQLLQQYHRQKSELF